MPEFTNPFVGMVPREMTHGELIRAILLNIAAEYEAVHIYMAHMDATSNADAKKVLFDIAREELTHAGEFTSLLYRLDAAAAEEARAGFGEVEELLQSKAPVSIVPNETTSVTPEPTPGLTIGSLKEG